jgi:kynurenine formamidase
MSQTTRLSNWGRWGAADQIGTANLVTPEAIVRAARLVRRGAVFSCALPLDDRGPVYPGRLPAKHLMSVSGADYEAGARGIGSVPEGGIRFADDYLFAPLQCSTQWDGLAHAWYGTELYNGVSQRDVRATSGARHLGIEHMCRHFVARGLLLDIVAALDAGPRLDPGYAITANDLDRAVVRSGAAVEAGDVLLVRTGHLPWFYELKGDKTEFWKAAPGLGRSTVEWLHAHDIAAVALDNITAEVQPAEEPGAVLPLHGLLIRDLGLTLGEMFLLEDLAADCRVDGVYEFLFVAQPLKITGAVGSPINPLAIK